MSIYFFIVIIFFIIISFALSNYLRSLGTDSDSHRYIFEELKFAKGKLPRSPTLVVNEASWGAYPLLYHYLFQKFNSVSFEFISKIQNSLLIVCIALYISYCNDQISIILVCLILFYPANFEIINARNVGFSSRTIGIFAICIVIQQGWYSDDVDYVQLTFGIVLATIINTFSLQFLIILAITSFIFLESVYILPCMILTILTLSSVNAYFRDYFFDTFNFWRVYQKEMANKFILMNYPSYYLTPFLEFKSIMRERNLSRLYYLVTRNYIFSFLTFHPFVIVLVVSPYGLTFPTITALITSILISFRPLRFWGEPQRYLDFVYPFVMMDIFLNFGDKINYTALGYSSVVVMLSFLQAKLTISHTTVNYNFFKDQIVNYVLSKNKEGVVFSNNMHLTKPFLAEGVKSITLWSSEKGLCGLSVVEAVEKFPLYTPKAIETVFSKEKFDYYVDDARGPRAILDAESWRAVASQNEVTLYERIERNKS